MDKPGYTKGPWVVKRSGPMVWVESPFHTVCSFYRENVGYAPSVSMDSEANARLIAAAPEMFEALQNILLCPAILDELNGDNETNNAVAKARAALSKATGGSHEQG